MHVKTWLKVLVLASLVATPLRAQDEDPNSGIGGGGCGTCATTVCGITDQHHSVSGGGDLQGSHDFCLRCTGGGCGCHSSGGCGLPAPEAALFVAASNAIQRGDLSAVIQVGRSVPGMVVFNRRRNAVQLWSCDGTILVASVNVRDAKLVTLAASTLIEAHKRQATVALTVAARRELRWGADRVAASMLLRSTAALSMLP
jgi:hypothetical protein